MARLSDYACRGECYDHGKWRVRVRFLGCEGELVADECPQCLVERLANEISSIEEKAYIAGQTERYDEDLDYGDGYDNGWHEGIRMGRIEGARSALRQAASVIERLQNVPS